MRGTSGIILALAALVLAVSAAPAQKKPIVIRAGPVQPFELKADDTLDFFGYYQGLKFYTDVKIGTPAQSVKMLFDTYSQDTAWVFSSECAATQCAGHTTFDASKSTSGLDIGIKADVPYANGDMKGKTYNDLLNILGIGQCKVNIEVMSVVPPGHFENVPFDGSLGMTRPAEGNRQTLMQTLVKQGILAEEKFAFYEKAGTAFVALGGFPTWDVEGEIVLKDTLYKNDSQWQFRLDGLELDNGREKASACLDPTDKTCTAQALTSSPFIVGPKAVIANMNKVINAKPYKQGLYAFDSCDVSKLPKLSFFVGKHKFEIDARNYVIETVDKNKQKLCLSALAGWIDAYFWIIGQPIIGPLMTTFNPEIGQLGFANVRSE